MRLVRNFPTSASDDISALLLFYVVQLLLSSLVNGHNIFLEYLELLLESVQLVIEIVFRLLVLVELLVQDDNLVLIVELLSFVKGLLENDSLTLVLQFTILVVVND